MKAAVLFEKGDPPRYGDVPEPVAQNDDEILVTVKAVAIKHFDKGRAAGTHYSSEKPAPEGRVIGGDGVCLLPDGTRIYAIGAGGMLAEKALIDKDRMVKLPGNLSDATAAAMANAVIGSAMALCFKAGIKRGDVVLINGATGFTGRMAVQVAKHYGAGKIIATGRNRRSLDELLQLGADSTICTEQSDEALLAQLHHLNAQTPLDIVIDYLWGHTAELILQSLRGNGHFTNEVRFVSVGSVSGDLLPLSAATLRSVQLQLTGSGLGSWSKLQVRQLFSEILPEMFQLAAEGKLLVQTREVSIADIGELWIAEVGNGERIVVMV